MKLKKAQRGGRARRRIVSIALTTCCALTAASCASTDAGSNAGAEGYPSETVTIVVPYSPGGVSDITMRALAKFMEKETGQTFVVENRDGASGSVAMRYAMNQPADGLTLFNIGQGANIITPILEDVDYDRKSMVPVANVAAYPSAMVVSASSDAQTAEDLFEEARQSPGSVDVATAGATTPGQIAVELLGTGPNAVPFKPVPFPGNAPALTALLGDNVEAMQINLDDNVLARAEKGDIKILAVGTPERLDYIEDVPTYKELGFEDNVYSTSPYIVGVKKGTDQELIDKLAPLINKATQDEEFQQAVGERFVTEGDESPQDLLNFINETDAAYGPLLEGM